MKKVSIKILEMEQGEFDVYNMTSEEPKFMLSVLPDDLVSFITGLRKMNDIEGNDFDIVLATYKSYDLMFSAHMAWELEDCDCIYGGVYEDAVTDCFVCDLINDSVSNYYENLGVNQNA